MSSQTPSPPSKCKYCKSSAMQVMPGWNGRIICHGCNRIFDPEESASTLEITASVVHCPHCETVDEIVVHAGEEGCENCGLDPNILDYPIEKLAHLWKQRDGCTESGSSLIGEVMLRTNKNGEPRFTHTSAIGSWLRTTCGPHCAEASDCEQTVKQIFRCRRESKTGSGNTEDDSMSKRRKRGGRGESEKKRKKKEKKLSHSRAWLLAPSTGWFVSIRNHESETIYQERIRAVGDKQ